MEARVDSESGSSSGEESWACGRASSACRGAPAAVAPPFASGQHDGGPERDDVVLWLAAEAEFLRRGRCNDRQTITQLRAQLHTAKRALRTLHAQGARGGGSESSEEQHRCLIAQLSNLDRLALDWARRCEALDGEARELCQLRVEHAQVLKVSQALRTAHEDTIRSLESGLDRAQEHCKHVEGKAASLHSAREELAGTGLVQCDQWSANSLISADTILKRAPAQVAALSCRANVSKCELSTLELDTDGSIGAIEGQVHSMQSALSSLEGAVPMQLLRLQYEVANLRAEHGKEAEARRQRDVQVQTLSACA
jgi:hypothetical protein